MDNVLTKALAFTLKWEGGFVNAAGDPGGATKYGISLPYAKSVGLDKDGDGDVDEQDIRLLTIEDAIAKYKRDFWDQYNCSSHPCPYSIALFDTCVQHSPAAVELIEEEAKGNWRLLIEARKRYALAWIGRKPDARGKFQKGFINRYNDLRKVCEIEESAMK